MSWHIKIQHMGDSSAAWRILAVFAGIITCGYYYLFVNIVEANDGLYGARAAAGLIASFLLTMYCWNTSKSILGEKSLVESYPELKPNCGPLVVSNDEWTVVLDELMTEIREATETQMPEGRWEPPPTWREDMN